MDLGVLFQKLPDPHREPGRAERNGGRDPQGSLGLFHTFGQQRFGLVDLAGHFPHGREQSLALFGEQQTPRVAMK